MEALKWTGSLLLWGLLLFAQHVVCFDVFDTNYGYLYLLTLVLAGGQFAVLYRNRTRRIFLCACGLAYSVLGVLKLPGTLLLVILGGWQLSLLCQVLDFAGAAWSFWLAGTIRKKEFL